MLVVALSTAPADAARPGPFLEDGPVEEAEDAAAADTGIAVDTGGPAVCTAVTLPDGVQLPANDHLYRVWDRDNAWGTPRLIETLQAVTEELAWRYPHVDPLLIGDLSRQGGGWLHGHRSHRGGLDADVGIYSTGGRQPLEGLRTVRADDLDLELNLAFVRLLFDTGKVERILLDRRLIARLRAYAVDSGAMSEEEAREMFVLPWEDGDRPAWERDRVVHHVPGHHHHFHVRVYCDG